MYKIAAENLQALFQKIAADQDLYLPVKVSDQVNFKAWSQDAEVCLDTLKTVKSPKDAFFPQSENLYTCEKKERTLPSNHRLTGEKLCCIRYESLRCTGEIQILVSTTVVEVGVNVPNATVMMVENAERFGLAQLHQLRGRVGRGEYQSYCIFMQGNGAKEISKRLQILNKSNDGFYIAGEDLKLRGPGDLFGIRQSGLLEFKLGDIYQDADILKAASETASEILSLDADLSLPQNEELQRRLSAYMKEDLQNLGL